MQEIEQLFRLYQKEVYGYLLSLTHSPQAAEDLLSETFLQALQGLRRFRGQSSAKTWLFGIARNIWLEGLRKKHPTASTDELLEGCLAEDTLTERTDSRLQWQRVKELLQQRDDRARRVVQLRAMGYSYNEIAAELHISESSARVIEHRTRTWLKQQLAKEGYDL